VLSLGINKTDEMRRLALQLAIQLPEDVADARRVLGLTRQCLEKFLVEQDRGSPYQRAARLGWRLSLVDNVAGDEAAPAAAATRLRQMLLALGTLLISVPAGMLALALIGAGAISILGLGVMIVALVFGRPSALLLAAASAVVHNLLLVPPMLQLSWPDAPEMLFAGLYVLIALSVPWIASHARWIRELAGRPLQHLIALRRAA
jgi:hypothetical protein